MEIFTLINLFFYILLRFSSLLANWPSLYLLYFVNIINYTNVSWYVWPKSWARGSASRACTVYVCPMPWSTMDLTLTSFSNFTQCLLILTPTTLFCTYHPFVYTNSPVCLIVDTLSFSHQNEVTWPSNWAYSHNWGTAPHASRCLCLDEIPPMLTWYPSEATLQSNQALWGWLQPQMGV